MRDLDEFFADADDVIADWEASNDAAAWAADGSHENTPEGGMYAPLSQPRWDGCVAWWDYVYDNGRVIVFGPGTVLFAPEAAAIVDVIRGETDRAADLLMLYGDDPEQAAVVFDTDERLSLSLTVARSPEPFQ